MNRRKEERNKGKRKTKGTKTKKKIINPGANN